MQTKHLKLLVVALTFLPVASIFAAVAKLDLTSQGVLSATVDGRQLLKPGTPSVGAFLDVAAKQPLKSPKPVTSCDPSAGTIATTYDWGTMNLKLQPVENGLRFDFCITNTSNETISRLHVNLGSIPGFDEKTKGFFIANGFSSPLLATATDANGTVVLTAAKNSKPMEISFRNGKDNKTKEFQLETRIVLGGDAVAIDNVQLSRPLAAGATDSFSVDLLMGAAGTEPSALAKDLIDSYRQANPAQLKWEDRRPVLRLFFGGGLPKDQATANIKDPGSIKMPEPDQKFREHVLKRFAATVETVKAANAQGVILWDLEGETYPHATTYIGDPQLIRVLNPQMDLVIDDAMKIFKDAGIPTGITLRPSQVVYDAEKNSAKHKHEGYDPFEQLDAKVAYAKKRWGCTIFYVDTNFFWRPYGPEKKWESAKLAPEMWKKLLAKYPDTLFIPEFASIADYPYVAGYGEADMGDYGTSSLIRSIWPDAFRVIVIEDADAYEQYDRFVAAVRGKNSLMTYSFDPQGKNTVALQRIYKEAELLEKGEPAGIKTADKAKLLSNLTSPDLATRFFSASHLADLGDPSNAPTLLAKASDANEDWIVRRQAVRAFEKIPYPDAVPVFIGFVTDPKTMLYAAASKALLSQGSAVVEAVMGIIETQKDLRPEMMDTFGQILVNLKAADQVPRLVAIYSAIPEKASQLNSRKRSIINTLGGLGNTAAEPLLLEAFENPAQIGPATTALYKIDSTEGKARAKAALDKAIAENNKDMQTTLRDAMRKGQN
jgi:hypothetical protein